MDKISPGTSSFQCAAPWFVFCPSKYGAHEDKLKRGELAAASTPRVGTNLLQLEQHRLCAGHFGIAFHCHTGSRSVAAGWIRAPLAHPLFVCRLQLGWGQRVPRACPGAGVGGFCWVLQACELAKVSFISATRETAGQVLGVGTFSSCSVLRKMEKSTAADVAVYRMLSCSLIVIPLPQSKILKSLCYLYSQCDCRKVGLASTSQPPSLGSDKRAARGASSITAPPTPWVPLPPQLLLAAASQLCSAGGAALPDGQNATCITALL